MRASRRSSPARAARGRRRLLRPLRAAQAASTLALALLTACDHPKPPPAQTNAETPAASVQAASSAEPSAAPSAAAEAPVMVKVTDTLETSAGPVSITPIHHGTVAFAFKDKTIVVDPFSEAPSGSLPKADLVLITDIHGDHYDPKAIELVRQDSTLFVVPKVVADKLAEAATKNAVETLANGAELTALDIRIRAVAMYNLERGPEAGKLFHDKGRGNGYVLGFGDKQVYLSGDTECTPEMKALTHIDLAFVCMNLPYTMPPSEAAACVTTFKPKVLIPYHYRGSDLSQLDGLLKAAPQVELRKRDFYLGGEAKQQ